MFSLFFARLPVHISLSLRLFEMGGALVHLAIQLSINRNSAELTRLYPGVFKTPHSSSPIDSAGARRAVSKHG